MQAVEIGRIREALDAAVIEGEVGLVIGVDHVYASDLMSDVLAFGRPNSLLLTGLATQQSVISAHMAEFRGVVYVRGKKPRDGSARFAREHSLVLLSTAVDMYEACVRIEAAWHATVDGVRLPAGEGRPPELLLSRELVIDGNDFASAGMVSTEVKELLKKIGFEPQLVRRVAISTYEGEMNVVMHAIRARVTLSVTPTSIEVVIDDEGPGIPDVSLAMQEGWSTATEEMRAMGFGSGMGLANIKRNSDEMSLTSEVGRGTRLVMRFSVGSAVA